MKKIFTILLVSAIILTIFLTIFYFFDFDLIVNREKKLRKEAGNLTQAANNENCGQLYSFEKVGLSNQKICPRGDIGNFMVIDSVKYELVSVAGDSFASNRQALLNVCIKARGLAAWNQGEYEGCTQDPRIINFSIKNLSWSFNPNDFTDISYLISTAGAKPSNFDQIRQMYRYNPSVDSDIEYTIKTHKFVEPGRAH
jgi:hypothetical protein